MNEVEKEDWKEKWHQVETASKRKAVIGKLGASNATPTKQSRMAVTVQTNTASAAKTVAEMMKEQGEGYVEDKSVLKTLMEVQWVLKLGKTKVVVRNPANLPTAKEFMEAFK
eukprot:7849350-Ditylum_brightwellii.AAC.1